MNYVGHARLSPLRECHNTQKNEGPRTLVLHQRLAPRLPCPGKAILQRGKKKNEHFVEELYQSKVNSHEKSVERDAELTNQSNEIGTERSRSIWKHGKRHRGCHRSYRCFTAGAVGSLRPILLI